MMLDIPRIQVPFVDLRDVNGAVKESVLAAISDMIDTGSFSNGAAVAEFERAFASFSGTTHCVGVASGLDALRLSLIAAGIQPGEPVVVPANTFIATFEAVSQAGGVPMPVDVTEADWEIDTEATAAAFAKGVRLAMPVHLYGQLCDMDALSASAEEYGALVIEDACQAHGASRDLIRPGARALAAAFSFYPAKNFGAFGDAGALVTNDEDLADTMRALREHGQVEKYRSAMQGWTSRLDTIQASVLLAKLPQLTGENEDRRRAAAWYCDALADIADVALPPLAPRSEHVWHLYVIRTQNPSDLAAFLRERGIRTGRHYPEPPHLSAAYSDLGFEAGSFPVTEAISNECLSLPMFAGIREDQLEAVAMALHEYFGVD
jgi:dTDP-4-amino-4,6-dideoxygalactose transaminase